MSWIDIITFSAHSIQFSSLNNFFSSLHPLFLWNGYQKPKPWAFSAKLSSTGWPVLLRPYQVPKGAEQLLYGLIPTKVLDIPFLFCLDVMYFHAYSCAVQILWKSRLRLLHVWLLFLMENFHKYMQHCHSHGTSLYGVSWFLLQDLDHSKSCGASNAYIQTGCW